MAARRSVEERAERWQRRYTGPWRTVAHERMGLTLSYRQRFRPRIEYVQLWVAWHDLWTHGLWRGLIVPVLRRLIEGARHGK